MCVIGYDLHDLIRTFTRLDPLALFCKAYTENPARILYIDMGICMYFLAYWCYGLIRAEQNGVRLSNLIGST